MDAEGFDTRVLMVDRSRFACLRVASLLSDKPNVSFHFATNLDDALDQADHIAPTAILVNPNERSPETSPEVVIDALQERAPDAKVVWLSEGSFGDREGPRLDIYANKAQIIAQIATPSSATFAQSAKSSGPEDDVESLDIEGDARVLLVDDSQVVCRAFHQQLDAQPNIVFESCRDPTQAQNVAARFQPTVILLDLEMPKLNGFELIARFRESPDTATVPIIVLSGRADISAKVRAFSLGASDYAEKKMERVELTRRITYHSRAYRTAARLNDSITQLTAAKDRLERQGAFVRRTFGRYLSDEIVASILESPEGLELGGEKRVVTVMMTDLRSFTPLGELLSPQDLLTLLNNYLRAMTDVLLAHHGTIDEFIGDAILAVFGAPISRPDDAPRAVACAVAMQLAMDDVNAWNRRRGLPELAMGIGIHTGEVVVGNIGSERRAKYGIVGANVNLTARIESYTLGGQIFASAQTVAACKSELRIDDERKVLPKGFSKEITIYDIGGIGGEHQLFLAPRQESERHDR